MGGSVGQRRGPQILVPGESQVLGIIWRLRPRLSKAMGRALLVGTAMTLLVGAVQPAGAATSRSSPPPGTPSRILGGPPVGQTPGRSRPHLQVDPNGHQDVIIVTSDTGVLLPSRDRDAILAAVSPTMKERSCPG